MSDNETEPTPAEEPKPKKRPIGLVVVVAVVVLGAFFGVRMYVYNAGHVTTDDAYVTLDVIPINAQEAGSIVKVPVSENQSVHEGDLLAQLDDSTFQADVNQARANLVVAQANERSAAADLGLTQQTGNAQVHEAQGGVQVGGADIGTAKVGVGRADAGVATAEATLRATRSQATAAEAGIQTAIMDRRRLAQQLLGFQAAIASAEATVKVAQANLANAAATSLNADKDAARYRSLADQGAVAVSQAETRETAAANARAAVDAAREQVAAAQSAVSQRRADYAAAQQQVRLADSTVVAARAQARAAEQAVSAQAARVAQAGTDVAAAKEGVNGAIARQTQNVGKLQEAQALPKRLSIAEAARQQAIAKVLQAQAALDSSQVSLARTRIRAPATGKVSRKTAEIGQQVTPGQPLMAVVPMESPWIVANFKETQMAKVRPGLEVEIEIDAVPGHTFKGHVSSISAGTGSTFALLPADNSTGNFTKVVQRIPVKITLDPGQPDLDKLAAGLSASVAIIVK